MRHPHHVKAYTIKAHTIKGHQVKAHWAKKKYVKAVHVKGHNVGVPYTTKKVVKTRHVPTKKQAGRGDELGMCAVTAAGLVAGVNRRELTDLYIELSPLDDGVTIPAAIEALGYVAAEVDELAPWVILSLPDHAVVVDSFTPGGVNIISWGETHFVSWDYVNTFGEGAWVAAA